MNELVKYLLDGVPTTVAIRLAPPSDDGILVVKVMKTRKSEGFAPRFHIPRFLLDADERY